LIVAAQTPERAASNSRLIGPRFFRNQCPSISAMEAMIPDAAKIFFKF
jgi:hypothetical protein